MISTVVFLFVQYHRISINHSVCLTDRQAERCRGKTIPLYNVHVTRSWTIGIRICVWCHLWSVVWVEIYFSKATDTILLCIMMPCMCTGCTNSTVYHYDKIYTIMLICSECEFSISLFLPPYPFSSFPLPSSHLLHLSPLAFLPPSLSLSFLSLFSFPSLSLPLRFIPYSFSLWVTSS